MSSTDRYSNHSRVQKVHPKTSRAAAPTGPAVTPRPASHGLGTVSYLISSVEPFPLLPSLKVSKILSSGRSGKGAGINYHKKTERFQLRGPPETQPRDPPDTRVEAKAVPAPADAHSPSQGDCLP